VVDGADLSDLEGPSRILAKAKGGTVLFDEVGDFDDEVQARIVRMIDNPGEYSPRFMATSQRDLGDQMDKGNVRQDLYYRLNGATIHVPSLRERVDDIPLLVEHFLTRTERDGAQTRVFSQEALELFRAYSWPGNVRQLENAVKRLVLTARSEEINQLEAESVLGAQPQVGPLLGGEDTEKLSASVARHLRRYFDLHGKMLPPAGLYARILKEIEMPLIEIALDATGGNQAKCADLLGINRNTLRKKITDLDIQVTRRRKLM
ncbi:MAG: sigma 54-interacting transcriptional regulator, partial [Rhodobacteraceae bacterium]|nr:sigma 54-interacting transcriptional regulator [Paracoccaceae bacterium]